MATSQWWWSIWAWSVSITAIQAWRLYRSSRDSTISYLSFLRQVVMETLTRHGTKRLQPGDIAVRIGAEAGHSLRKDGVGHLIVPTNQSRRCGHPHCQGRARFQCVKCDVGLHPHCFYYYHTYDERDR